MPWDLGNNCAYGIIPALRRVQSIQGVQRALMHGKMMQQGIAKPGGK